MSDDWEAAAYQIGCEARTPLRCPECKTVRVVEDWAYCALPCEDCGEHPGVACPECEATFDCVFSEQDGIEELEKP